MKKLQRLYIRGLLVLSVFGAASCSIDEYNPSGATAEEIWSNTPEGFATAVNGAYHELRYWYGKEDGIFMSEAGTDIWANRGYGGPFSRYVALNSGVGYIKNTWSKLYSAVNVCNAGLDRIADVPFPNDDQRKAQEGQLRFLRAFYYWHIVETWGNVILRDHETNGAVLTAQRSPVESFYDLMISDLLLAVEYLPNDWGTEYGRATKKSALGMLARVYLTRAYYGDGPNYFTKARDAAKQVIDRQGEFQVALKPNYADLWNSAAANKSAGKAGGEALFVVTNSTNPTYNYDGTNGTGNRLHSYFQTPYNNYPGLILSIEYGLNGNQKNPYMLPTRALLDFYDEEIDSRYAGSFQEVWITNKAFTWTDANNALGTYGVQNKDASVIGQTLAVGDVALVATKSEVTDDKTLLPYVVFDRNDMYAADGTLKTALVDDGAVKQGTVTGNYPTLKKYRDYNRTAANTNPGFNDVIVMRLAEMYLIAAEAEFQLANSSAAADYINVLRTRAAIKTPVDHTADMQIDASDISLDFILDESAREFAGEFKRWFDLKRTRTLIDRVERYNPDVPTVLNEDYYVRPVSIDELNALLNADEFGQNHGYQ